MKEKMKDPFNIHTCVCGKTFIPTSQYVYKIPKNGKWQYYCSYTCWRKAGGGSAKKVARW